MYINVVKTAFAFPQQWGLNEIKITKASHFLFKARLIAKRVSIHVVICFDIH
jgi:hypothetical protein